MVAVLVVPARAATAVAATVAAGTLAVAALALRTGEAGGELVYRYGAATAYLPPGGAAPAGVPFLAPGGADRDDD